MNQEHLWQLNQMIPGTHLFNMPYVYQLTGELDIHALNRSLLELVRRHEALRTVFAEVAGRPVQIIREVSVPHLVPIDLRRDAPEAVFETAAGWILKERTDPFDLQSGPLLRLKLLRLTDSLSLLLIVMHHIISDHWSMNIFRDELNILYSAFSQGQLSPLTKPSFQFADYAYSERKLINDGSLDTQRRFWDKTLRRRDLSLPMHNDVWRSGGFRRDYQSINVDGPLFEQLKNFAALRHMTPFGIILTSLFGLMHIYTGQIDLRIGVLFANRRWQGSESVIGYFVNTLVLPIHVSVGTTFEDLLELTHERLLVMHENQEYPFEALARTLEMETSLQRDSLFQVLVAYNVASSPVYRPGSYFASLDLREVQMTGKSRITACDAVFNFLESSTKLSGDVNYRKNAFSRSSKDSLVRSFRLLIETVLFHTSLPLSSTGIIRRSTKSRF